MAAQQDWKKRREKELEELESDLRAKAQKTGSGKAGAGKTKPGASASRAAPGSSASLEALLDRAGPLIDRLDSLYRQYLSGAEKRPPVEARRQLDECITQIQAQPRATQLLKFRTQSLLAHYQTYRDRWEKMLQKK